MNHSTVLPENTVIATAVSLSKRGEALLVTLLLARTSQDTVMSDEHAHEMGLAILDVFKELNKILGGAQ